MENEEIDPGEIVINKNHLAARDKFSILKTEAYAMPSSTYVQDDSHAFLVSLDRTLCWANYGRCWNAPGEKILVAEQNSYKEWLLEFCPPNDLNRCGLIFGTNGVCHTYTNRELLIGEKDVSVKAAAKNYVVLSVFGKYGFGLEDLKKLIAESFNRANFKVEMTQDMLDTVLARVDNTLEDETSAWGQLIENYFSLQMSEIIQEHEDALEQLKNMVVVLVKDREKAYSDFYDLSIITRQEFKDQMLLLLIHNADNYFDFLLEKNYISKQQNDMAKQSADKFFRALFRILDEQVQTIAETGKMDQNLARGENFM